MRRTEKQRNHSPVTRERLRAASKLGNAARQAKTTPEQRSAIARLGGLARWARVSVSLTREGGQ